MVNQSFTVKYRPEFINQFKIKELQEIIRTFINIET